MPRILVLGLAAAVMATTGLPAAHAEVRATSPDSMRSGSATISGPWSALGSAGAGSGALNGKVNAIAMSGNDIYVGGSFTNAGGLAGANFIAKWNGSTWSAVGPPGALNDQVHAIAVSGNDVYVGGRFTNASGLATADYVAKWNGTSWSALASSNGDAAIDSWVYSLATSGNRVFVGGDFTDAAGIPAADYVAMWDGSTWSPLGSNGSDGAIAPTPLAPKPAVFALAVSGSNVYVGGSFIDVMGVPEADAMVTWNGATWAAMGSGDCNRGCGAIDGAVYALAVSGSDLYAGGGFVNVGTLAGDYVAKWDGSAWSALGTGAPDDGAIWNGNVNALAVAGGDVYAGGEFFNAAGVAEADRLARWDGSAWTPLGSGGPDGGALSGVVNALAVSPNLASLYVGGDFTDTAGISAADNIALWGAARVPTRLSISAKSKATKARPVKISGVLSSSTGTCARGQRVTLTANGKRAGSKATTASGSYSFTFVPTVKTVVEVSYPGSAACGGSQSTARTISIG